MLGARDIRRLISPLHSEVETLLWAMSSILENNLDCQDFETDYSDLIRISQTPEKWPVLPILTGRFSELQTRFQNFTLTLISRLSNPMADCLARSARFRSFEFFFVSNSLSL